MPVNDLADLSAVELADAIRRKAVSPREAVEAALARIEARAELNAFITVTADDARAAAREAERRVMSGDPLPPLHGIPYSVKDLLNTAGVRTTMGSAIFADFVPTEDAVAVARAKQAGAILIGKTTTPEFGHKQAPEAPIFGRTLSPINPAYTPGASSSGAAVAVAVGMGPIALGTDGGGSIRIPASCCGVVGLKPTLGAVPHLQVPDLFSPNSYVGPLARTVADTALLFEAIAGPDRRDPYGQLPTPAGRRAAELRGLRVGWLPRCGARVDREVAARTSAAVELMAAHGASVEEIDLDFASLEGVFLTILRVGLAARLGKHLDRFADRMDPSLVRLIHAGQAYSAVQLSEAAFARTAIFGQAQQVFEQFDVLASPTLTAPPLAIDQDPDGTIVIDGEPAGTIRAAWYPGTFPLNLTGHPALSLPCGASSKGLPIGLQLIGRWHADRHLLDVAGWLESEIRSGNPGRGR